MVKFDASECQPWKSRMLIPFLLNVKKRTMWCADLKFMDLQKQPASSTIGKHMLLDLFAFPVER